MDENYLPYPKVYDAISQFLQHLEKRGFFKQNEVENLAMQYPDLKNILEGLFKEMEDNLKAYYRYKTGQELE